MGWGEEIHAIGCDCAECEADGEFEDAFRESFAGIAERGWNDDPAWTRYVTRFEDVIIAITNKYTTDEGLKDDCAQEARIALLTIHPEQVLGYEKFVSGEYTEVQWNDNLDRYCRNVIRNTVISYLESLKTGSWYHGRTRRKKAEGEQGSKKYRIPPRYVRLEDLLDGGLAQINETGEVIWERGRRGDLDPAQVYSTAWVDLQ